LTGFGRPFEIESVLYKRYASCYFTHATVRCMLEIREKHQPALSKMSNVTVEASSLTCTIAGNPEPQTGLEGKFSARFCAAVALMRGTAVESDFTNESVNEPEIRDMMSRINVVQDESLEPTEAAIHIKMTDGTEIKKRLELVSRETAVPIPEWESLLEAKAGDLLQGAFPPETTGKILSATKKLEEIDNIKDIIELMS